MTTIELTELRNEMMIELRYQLNEDFKSIIENFMLDMKDVEDEKYKQLKKINTEMTLAEFVKEKRKENGYTLDSLSKKIDCSVVYLHQIEKGKCKNISMKVFRNICKALNYSADNLLEYLILEN